LSRSPRAVRTRGGGRARPARRNAARGAPPRNADRLRGSQAAQRRPGGAQAHVGRPLGPRARPRPPAARRARAARARRGAADPPPRDEPDAHGGDPALPAQRLRGGAAVQRRALRPSLVREASPLRSREAPASEIDSDEMAGRHDSLIALFRELAQLTVLEEGSPNAFRVRAYENALEAISSYRGDLGALTEKQLTGIGGIGASTAKKIREFFEGGT